MPISTADPKKLIYSVGVGFGVTTLSYWLYKQWTKDVIPKKWRAVGTLAQINIFPIKSCAPLKLEAGTEVECDVLGARIHKVRDRCLMLVDENDKIITARDYSKMVLIESTMINSTTLLLTAPGISEPLVIDLALLGEQPAAKYVHTMVWGAKLDAMLCGEMYDKWFSQAILQKEVGLRLVYFAHAKPVKDIVQRMKNEPFITTEDTGTFTDATSYMLMNLASVDDLNKRTPRPVDTLQFRGNFHLKMNEDVPFAEDKWKWIKIGNEAIFRNVAPCTRCVVPNINPITGERDPGSEPLKTLHKYRKWENYASPSMGIHLGIRQLGTVKLNDIVYVEEM